MSARVDFPVQLLGAMLYGMAVLVSAAPGTDKSAQTSGVTQSGNYAVRMFPESGPPRVAEIQNWVLHVEAIDGSLFIPRQLVLSGGMPGHGHGLPTEPRISRYLGNGDYLVEGVKFNMPGTWQLIVGVTGPQGPEQAVLEVVIASLGATPVAEADDWSAAELQLMKSLSLDSLAAANRDASNRFSGVTAAADLGELLFNDKGLSGSAAVACATCHKSSRAFADDKQFSKGTAATQRNAPGLLGVSYHKWFYWDGRRDSLWAQAITPIETPGEMDNQRVDVVRYVLQQDRYSKVLKTIGAATIDPSDRKRFPPGAGPFAPAGGSQLWWSMQPADRDAVNKAFSDIGKILAAYMERLQHAPSRFDRFVDQLESGDQEAANAVLSVDERQGLKLFLDVRRSLCLRCHNGPLFTNFGFHNIATGISSDGQLDFGRMLGLQAAMVDEFNCQGQYSDARKVDCKEMRFVAEEHSAQGAFKVPGLRDVAMTAPYMHDGRYTSLSDVVEFYTQQSDPEVAPSEIAAVNLTPEELGQLVAFLGTLTGKR